MTHFHRYSSEQSAIQLSLVNQAQIVLFAHTVRPNSLYLIYMFGICSGLTFPRIDGVPFLGTSVCTYLVRSDGDLPCATALIANPCSGLARRDALVDPCMSEEAQQRSKTNHYPAHPVASQPCYFLRHLRCCAIVAQALAGRQIEDLN